MLEVKAIKQSNVEEFIKEKNNDPNHLQFMWLGQAGFIFKFNEKILIIDAYLSDFLAKKYKGKLFSHIRLMNPPILPSQILNLDYFLSTHAHSDHMDPETISPIAVNNPECKFVVPAAEVEEAIIRGMSKQKIIPINAHQRIKLDDMISISAIPAAHESLKLNSRGEHHFLGYILHFNKYNIYHSGDCVPYDELEKFLKWYNINAAFLPINGRDEYRLNNGIAGNFQVYEALNLCTHLKIKYLIVHHFGMFAYNTVKDEILNDISRSSSQYLQIIIPKINVIYQFNNGT